MLVEEDEGRLLFICWNWRVSTFTVQLFVVEVQGSLLSNCWFKMVREIYCPIVGIRG